MKFYQKFVNKIKISIYIYICLVWYTKLYYFLGYIYLIADNLIEEKT